MPFTIAVKQQASHSSGTESTESELEDLLHDLSCGGTKPLVLSLVSHYSDSYMPKSSLETFPRPLKSLQQAEYLKLSYTDLLDICEFIEIQITDDMAKAVERGVSPSPLRGWSDGSMATSLQTLDNNSAVISHKGDSIAKQLKIWYTYRAGRVTASHT